MRKESGTERERAHCRLLDELQNGFPRRLKRAIGDRSVHSFARSCGMSDSLVRKYLSGSLPGLGKALIMAREAGVSLEWLAMGTIRAPASAQARPAVELDGERMERVIARTRRAFVSRDINLSPEDEAKVIRLICELDAGEMEPAHGPDATGLDAAEPSRRDSVLPRQAE